MKLRRSVRFRLALWYMAVLALGMAAFGGISWLVLRQVSIENESTALDQRLRSLESFLSSESRGNDLTALREEAREYSTSLPEGQGFTMATAEGRLLFEKLSARGPALTRGKRITVRGHAIHVALSVPLADFYRILRTLAWVMAVVFPAVLLIALSGGWWLAKRALMPVGAMTREARNISARDLGARLSVPDTGDEIEDLAAAWNELLTRIESAVSAVKRFTADAAHELRTPVTVIRTAAELAVRHPRSPEAYRQTLLSIEHETIQMTELLDQLLLLARGDAGEWRFHFDTVFADQLLRGLRPMLDPLAESRQVQIEWQIPEESVGVWADEKTLRQLVLILVDNALKHTPPRGQVFVQLRLGNDACTLDVADTGTGIAAEDLPYIFDRFYRSDPARSPGAGVGLGLAIARTIVDAHYGSIEVLSTGKYKTVFRVVLPLSQPAPRPSQDQLSEFRQG